MLRRRGEKREQTRRIGAVLLEEIGRADDVAARLGHLFDAPGSRRELCDHALRKQIGEGLVAIYISQIAQGFGEETRIEQMQNRVLDTADVLIDGHPVIDLFFGERFLIIQSIGIAQEIPAGADKGVHGVGFALSRTAALMAFDVDPVFHAFERRAAFASDFNPFCRQNNRKVFFLLCDHPTLLAVDDGNRATPIALAANQPAAQTVLNSRFSTIIVGSPFDHFFLGFIALHSVKTAGIDHDAYACVGLFHFVDFGSVFRDHLLDRQIELFGKLEIALIMSRNVHHSTGSIIHERIVGNPDRNNVAIKRINHM